jgi:hypothetical protein
MSVKAFLFVSVVMLASAITGCQPHIGDKCVLNTDCSVTGTLQCDTSMPGGYCTQFNCGPNSCPNGNACYLFHAEVQGCPYNDRTPSRTGHSFCMEGCATNSDCRYGYSCNDLRQYPWYALLLDDNQEQKVCSPNLDTSFYQTAPDANAPPVPICESNPDYDAAFPPEDSGAAVVLDAGVDGSLDAGVDATLTDAGGDASDAGAPDAPNG